MMETMPVKDFYDWMMLEQIEPFGEAGHYLRAGIIASVIANVNRGKDQPAFSPFDFMPMTFRPPVKIQTGAEHKTALMAIMHQQNAIAKAREGIRGRTSGH
jgi:hypothetical protein